ncbi:MAG: transporter related [Herbinix sp.]|jgi:ATP-binding cassette subfamily B protein|nr:transporter related [Herbinix sp.]
MGLYEVSGGEIIYNGTDIKEFTKNSYRSKFATVFQDFQLYALSIASNIIMREVKTKEDEEKVLYALKKVGLEEKVINLENGINTNLTHEFDENGAILSGGEAQKIALARTFANDDAEIIILDEPTSALDPISEYNMYENMMQATMNKTVIFISHRLSSARMADKIYMIDCGRIIEQGTHDELMDIKGKYSELFRKQAQNYIDEDVLEGVKL